MPDREVRYKVMAIHSVCTNGEPHSVWILSIEGKYRASFRFESDLVWFMDKLKSEIDGKLVEELPYNLNSKI